MNKTLNKLLTNIKKNYPYDLEPIYHYDNNIPTNFLLNEYNGNFVINGTKEFILNIKKSIILEYDIIKLHIYYNKDDDINITHLIKIIKRCYTIIKIYDIKKIINIYVLMSDKKRYFPNKKNILIDCNNINGGFTNINGNKIFILRKEEYSKVILHELLHHVNILNNYDWDDNNINKLKEHFKISKNTLLAPNEAITEIWATIYLILFINYEYNIPYKMIINYEINRSLYLSYKLLKYQGNNLWNEKTNAYCYILFKTILLNNLNKLLLKYTYPYDINYLTKFFIDNTVNLKIIKNNYYKNIKNNSMRMTVFGDF
jgi:hypothetical protein